MAVLYQTERERERPMERDVIREEDRCVGEEIDWLLSECAADSCWMDESPDHFRWQRGGYS